MQLHYDRIRILMAQCRNFFEFFHYHWNLYRHKPYLGSYLAAFQGCKKRHEVMARFLERFLSRNHPPTFTILEIGSWAGGSALLWSRVLSQFPEIESQIICVDPWEPYDLHAQAGTYASYIAHQMRQGFKNNRIYWLFLHNTRSVSNRVYYRGTSKKILPLIVSRTLDLIYLDGSHTQDDVGSDLRNSDRLLKDRGILCGDDLEKQHADLDLEALQQHATQDYVKDSRTGKFYHPGVTLGVFNFFGRSISKRLGFWAVQKRGDRYVDVEI